MAPRRGRRVGRRQRHSGRCALLSQSLGRRDLEGPRALLQALLLPPPQDRGDGRRDADERPDDEASPAGGGRVLPFSLPEGGRGVRTLAVTGDDFGRSRAVNRGIAEAYDRGVLTSASLMVAGDAAAEAVEMARCRPGLAVGIHLVVVEGRAALPHREIPAITDAE